MHRFLIQTVVLLAISYPAALSAELSLQVLDPHELPVPGAVVEILNPSPGSPLFSVVTDDTGCAEISLVLPATLRVKAPGFEPLDHKVGETTDTQVKLRLVPAILRTTIEVTVKDEQTPDTVTESSAFVIERNGARTVYDAVDKLVPSAYVPSRGVLGHGLGISNSISIRGLGGSPTTQLLVVIDGRPEVMGLMGHPIPDFYSLTDVGSVAITTAPASVLYGNRAMGGAIEIKPTQPQQGFHTELTVGLGSFYTGQDRLSHSGQLDRFYYKVAGGIEHTNGHRPNSSFRNQDGALHLSYNLSPAWTANVDGLYGHFNVEDPGTVQAPTPGHWSRVGRGGYSVGLQNRREQSWGSMLFFSSHGHHMLYDGFRSFDSNTGFRIHETFLPARNVEIDFGADAARYGGRARNISTGVDFGEYHVSEGGGFARGRWTIARRLQVNAGFRYDHNSVFGGVTATEFGASYRFSDDYALSLAIGKGFRNPTIRELYLFPAPTPTLQPERLWNYQATFQMHPVARLLAWITGYYSDISNLIVTTGRFPDLKLENIGRASNRGLEINARWIVMRHVSLSSGYAYLSSTNLAPYVPENKLNYSLDVDLKSVFITVGGSTVGRTWANTAKTVQLGGYTAATLKCTVPIGSHWSAFAMVDNLFNRNYQEIAGYPMPGANAAGGLKIRF